jgi:hypothetical protein
MKALVVDDAMKAGTHIGPVVDQSHDQDLSYIAVGKKEGAKLHWGGELLNRDNPGANFAGNCGHMPDIAAAEPGRLRKPLCGEGRDRVGDVTLRPQRRRLGVGNHGVGQAFRI